MSFFDGLGELCLSAGKKRPFSRNPQRILIFRLDSLGDAVLTLPAIRLLESWFPGVAIDFVVSPTVRDFYALLFPNARFYVPKNNWLSPGLSRIALLGEYFETANRLKTEDYDLAIDFRGDLRSILLMCLARIPERWGRDSAGGGFLLTRSISNVTDRHEVLQNLDLIRENGAVPTPSFPQFVRLSEAANGLDERLLPLKGNRKIVLHLGAGYPSKRWPAAHYVSLARQIQKAGLGLPIFIGGETEKSLLAPYQEDLDRDYLNLMGQTTLEELLTLLSQADLFIGNDSGPAHLAAFLGKPLVVVFSGTNDFRKWAPWTTRQKLVRHDVSCSPCEERKCPLARHYCMEDIPVEEVFRAVQEMLHD